METTISESRQQLIDNVLSVAQEIEETNDLWNILERALDIEYTIDSRGNFLGATICVATGGPHIEIDTRYNKVRGYWGQDNIERSYEDNADLHGYMEETMPF